MMSGERKNARAARRRAAHRRARSPFLPFIGGVLLTLLAVSFVFLNGRWDATLSEQRAALPAAGVAARSTESETPGPAPTQEPTNTPSPAPTQEPIITPAPTRAPAPEASTDGNALPAPRAAAAARSVRLNVSDSITMQVGETGRIRATLDPEDPAASFTWKSSDEKVVKVNQKGEVKAVGAGKAKVGLWIDGEADASAVVAIKVEKKSEQGEVWIPRTGKKYHANKNCSNMKNPKKVSLSEAKRLGYGACKKCY